MTRQQGASKFNLMHFTLNLQTEQIIQGRDKNFNVNISIALIERK